MGQPRRRAESVRTVADRPVGVKASLDTSRKSLYEGARSTGFLRIEERGSEMRRWHMTVALVTMAVGALAVSLVAQQRAESRDMTLLGSNDLQARSAYQ